MIKTCYVGKTYPIHDAANKAMGKELYVGDLNFPGMLHAKLLYSNIAHGNIVKIDTSEAERLPGVIKIFTHENSSKVPFNSFQFFADQDVRKDEFLFNNKVRFWGDRIAGVLATSPSIAEDALRLIKVEYELLPVLLDLVDSEMTEYPLIHDGSNLIKTGEINFGNVNSIMNKSSRIYSDTIITPKVHHAAMENHCCVARYEKPSGMLTIWTPCQSVFAVRLIVAEVVGIPFNRVRVIKTTTGGSFGGKQHTILEPIAAFMAYESQGTVRLQFGRTESMLSTITRTAVEMGISTVVDGNGIIHGSRVEAVVDAGAYISNSADLAMAMGKKLFRVYRIPNLNYSVKSIYTNSPTSGGCRGWGSPQANTSFEIHLDNIANKIGMDPADLRMKNLVYPGDIDHSSGVSLGNARIRECLEIGVAEFDWKMRRSKPKDLERFKRGVGLACAGHVNGFYGKIQDLCTMTLKMNEDGSCVLNTGVHDQGCGTLVSMGQIVAEVLEIDPMLITVLEADTQTSPYDMGTFSSRVTYVSGMCALRVAEKLKSMLLEQAAVIFGKSSTYLQCSQGKISAIGSSEAPLSFAQIAVTAQVKHQVDLFVVDTYRNVSNPGAYGVHFAEVEVDTMTGMVNVIDYLAVHDVGRALNRGMIEGQIQGGVQMGIGYALTEELKFNKEGQPLNNSFMNYTIINATDMPDVKVKVLEYGGDDGPFGAKSVGEIAVVSVAAAVVNAVNHALGTQMSHLPLTPEKIIEAINPQE